MSVSRSPLERLLAAGCYFGAAPLLVQLVRSRFSDPFLHRHYAQAMAVAFLLPLLIVLWSPVEAGIVFLFARFPEFQSQITQVNSYVTYAELALLAVVFLFWLVLLALAIAGSMRQIPLIKQLARRSWIIRLSVMGNSIVLALLPVVAVAAVHATSLTRPSHDSAAVYFLYDEGIPVPRWGYALGLYRLSWQAERNWGKGSTVLDRLNQDTFRTALTHAKVLILATHGGDGYVVTYYAPQTLCVGPSTSGLASEAQNARFLQMSAVPYTYDNWELVKKGKWENWENVRVNSYLQLAYIFACNAGQKALQWQDRLAPAQVVTYNRPSTILDHARWFALTGPSQLQRLR